MINGLKHVNVMGIQIQAKPGASIGQCLNDAAIVCLVEQWNVVLVHNEKTYKVIYLDIARYVENLILKS